MTVLTRSTQSSVTVVDEDVGPGLPGDLELLRRAGGGDDAGAERLPELDRREPHAPRRAVDEEPLARLEGGAPDEGRVSRLVDDEEGRGLVERHPVGNRVHALRGGDRPLRVAAPFEVGDDALAGADARHAGADRADDAGDLVAGAERVGRLDLVFPLDHEDVGEVAPDRPGLDRTWPGPGSGSGTSRYSSSDGSPHRVATMAFMTLDHTSVTGVAVWWPRVT